MNTNYKNLKVWSKSVDFVSRIYEITSKFPNDEKFSLVSQIRRAAVSIPSNIAEWSWRNGIPELRQFLYISKWSCLEVETQLIISKNLWFISESDFEVLNKDLDEIIKMLQWFINSKF
ncbi:MAG: S23 ribosomal protein [uncultured bacterium (gcode 4)]|uniref:S23 ribosomal protein n=1 Tax=uncultured bacterium (gcode 4) TaxID=1234023 RepID=K2GZK6_9BACT|nr:MAG: S23 ribosomal protein [uncultured bacterium (gcode 4)]